jgi:hypothetical protein
LLEHIRNNMLSKIPGHPASAMLFPNFTADQQPLNFEALNLDLVTPLANQTTDQISSTSAISVTTNRSIQPPENRTQRITKPRPQRRTNKPHSIQQSTHPSPTQDSDQESFSESMYSNPEKPKKRKLRKNTSDLYEVEEILAHHQDEKVIILCLCQPVLMCLMCFNIRVIWNGRSNGRVIMRQSGCKNKI